MKTSRRTFLKGAAIAGAAGAAVAILPENHALPQASPPPPKPPLPPPAPKPRIEGGQVRDAGSDFMVDVIKALNIGYVACNPAHSFRGLHESLIDYGGNKQPEFLLTLHEESAVAMAHGYFKVAGKPMIALMHGTVGVQHAAMAIYNAWCDRVPVIVVGGNELDAAKPERGKDIISVHSAQDVNVLVRDFTKWDDTPMSLQHFADSFVRAYKLAMTPPHEPVMLTIDACYQQEPIGDRSKLAIPRYVASAPPQGEAGAVRAAARMLAAAERPVVVVDRAARTPRGMQLVVELCELLQAPCLDLRARMNIPNTHYLCRQLEDGDALVGTADVILGVEVANYFGVVSSFVDNNKDSEGETKPLVKPGTKLLGIGSVGLSMKSNYQDMQRFQALDVDITGDGEATLPLLIAEVKTAITARRRSAIASRAPALRAQYNDAQAAALAAAKKDWNASPISPARVTLDLLDALTGLDWSLVGGSRWMVRWARRLWPLERHYHYLGLSGGDGRGYELPSAIGAALANRDAGRISINLQSDGALMYTPQALWTAVHHKIPLLTVMMNNRCYQSEFEHIVKVAGWRGRKPNHGPDSGPVGTMLENPNIDFALLARAQGMYATGPITKPADLAPALRTALQVVKAGQPALVDVVTAAR
jgi:acetolactate synthase I/II/III large subunit